MVFYTFYYHSTFIGRADAKNKGRISRYLANKYSIATRIDSFSDDPNRLYGEKLRDQVEERLKFYETGAAPRKNLDVMEEIAKQIKASKPDDDMDDDDEDMADAEETPKPKKDKKKKKSKESSSKKRKASADDEEDEDDAAAKKSAKKSAKKAKKEAEATPKSDKKKKKKKSKSKD